MLRSKLLLLIISAVLIALGILVFVKYQTFRSYTNGMNLPIVLLDTKLGSFYGSNLRFPRSRSEYDRFLSEVGDYHYASALAHFNYKLDYDSINSSLLLYANGMDWDNDHGSPCYYIQSKNFFEAFFIDGDVVLQKVEIRNILNLLPREPVILGSDEATSERVAAKVDDLSALIWNQVYHVFDSNGKLESYREDPINGGLIWIEIRCSKASCSVSVYTLLGDEVLSYLIDYLNDYIKADEFSALGDFSLGFRVNAFGPPPELRRGGAGE
jgi:hypothetical protein